MMDVYAIFAAVVFTAAVLYTLDWYMDRNQRRYR